MKNSSCVLVRFVDMALKDIVSTKGAIVCDSARCWVCLRGRGGRGVHEGREETRRGRNVKISSCVLVRFVDMALKDKALPFETSMAPKIDQQANPQPGGFQVIQDLRLFLS